MFIEAVLPSSIIRELSEAEMNAYRAPHSCADDRQPLLNWPRQIPIDGEPENIVALVNEYGAFMAESELPKLSGKTPLANAIRYALTRMKRLRGYLDHGFLELDNNTAERSMRGIAIGRKNYMFVGYERVGKSAAIIYTLMEPPQNSTTLIPRLG